jgi:hypothetical protein
MLVAPCLSTAEQETASGLVWVVVLGLTFDFLSQNGVPYLGNVDLRKENVIWTKIASLILPNGAHMVPFYDTESLIPTETPNIGLRLFGNIAPRCLASLRCVALRPVAMCLPCAPLRCVASRPCRMQAKGALSSDHPQIMSVDSPFRYKTFKGRFPGLL